MLALVGCDVPACTSILGSIPLLGHVFKFGVAFPLVYHYLGGIRHIVWDKNPEMLENDKVEQSSKVLLGVSAVIGAACSFL
jgi:succinate dehydrogenase (ubiquinone) cytochrome b560 subunit